MAWSTAGTQKRANPRSSDDNTFQPEDSTKLSSSSFSESTSNMLGAFASCRLNLSMPDCSSVTV